MTHSPKRPDLDRLLDGQRSARWRNAPASALDAALHMPRSPRLARRTRETSFDWSAADVRGEGAGAVLEDARIVAGSCPSGEVSVRVRPPMEGPDWHFELRVWLHENPDATVEVGLVHEDHVLCRHEIADGRALTFSEVVGRGWELELHMPGGETVVLADPFADDDLHEGGP